MAVRYIFWDGVINVKEDNLDKSITCHQYYSESRPNEVEQVLILSLKPVKKSKEKVDLLKITNEISASIEECDKWFVPFEDILAIKLQIENILDIKSMLLRIRGCKDDKPDKVIYQETLDEDQIKKLPSLNVSVNESGKEERKKERNTDKNFVSSLIHLYLEVWISSNEDEFRSISHTDEIKEEDSAEKIVKKAESPEKAETGINQTISGSPLVEKIMADKTALIIKDCEPPASERLFKDSKQGDPSIKFPDFPATIRRTLYQICSLSRIGKTLIEDVSDIEANRDKKVMIFPVFDYHQDIAGVGVSNDYKDDYSIENKFKSTKKVVTDYLTDYFYHQKINIGFQPYIQDQEFNNLKADADITQYLNSCEAYLDYFQEKDIPNDYDQTRKGEIEEYFAEKRRQVQEEARQAAELAAQQLASQQLQQGDQDNAPPPPLNNLPPPPPNNGLPPPPPGQGLAPPPPGGLMGAKPKLPAIQENILDFAVRKWLYNIIGASNGGCESHYYFNVMKMKKFDRDEYIVALHNDKKSHKINNINVPVIEACQGGDTPPNIETPFFIAFAHEMIHARRFQLGMNAEYDVIKRGSNFHKDSVLNMITDKKLKGNIIDRYGGYNREEFDTIEGVGAVIDLTNRNSLIEFLDDKQIPHKNNKLTVTENVIRKELNMDMRRRYVEGKTGCSDANVAGKDFKYIDHRSNQSGPPPDNLAVTFDEIKDEIKTLINEISPGGVQPRNIVALKPDKNYFKYESVRFSLAYRFSSIARKPYLQLDEPEKNFIRVVHRDIIDHKNEIKTDKSLSGATKDNFSQIFSNDAADDEDKRVQVLQLIQNLFNYPAEDRVSIIKKSPNLLDAQKTDAGLDAFASYKTSSDAVNIARDLALVTTDGPENKAMYLPEKVIYLDKEDLCMILIHEPIHMFAIRRQGFMEWDLHSNNELWNLVAGLGNNIDQRNDITESVDSTRDMQDNLKSVFDEGTTEMLARIVLYRLMKKKGVTVGKVNLLVGMPYYMYPTHLICQLVRDLNQNGDNGLQLIAGAYFYGQWAPFNNALVNLSKSDDFDSRYKGFQLRSGTNKREPDEKFGFWKFASTLSISNAAFIPGSDPENAVQKLRDIFKINWDLPDEVRNKVKVKSFKDPVCSPQPLASGMGCTINTSSNSIAKDDKLPVSWKSICCKKQIAVPGTTILKR